MPIDELVGRVLTKIDKSEDEIIFETETGERWRMFHENDCCENVTVDDICGDLNDMLGTPIVQAFEKTSNENPPGVVKEYQDSFTWTFYTLATIKGTVTIRWYGESNGYYSESVDFQKLP